MLKLLGTRQRFCDGLSRRDLVHIGGLSCLGLSLPALFRQQARAGSERRPAADACLLIYLWGAPSQFETFDPKPEAPAEIRGEFGVIQTHVPGALLGEHIPLLSRRSKRYTIVRTCTQSSTSHQPGAYEALTGFKPSRNSVGLVPTAADHPNLGSVVARLARGRADLPAFVTLPQLIKDVGNLTPGQFAGFLGRQYDPFTVGNPDAANFSVASLTLAPEVTCTRLEDRKRLLRAVDGQVQALEQAAAGQALETFQAQAIRVLTSRVVQRAFDLGAEPAALRDRYGRNSFGQSCLLARRLVEAGVKLVTVFSAFDGQTPQDAWDTHRDNFRRLKNTLLPPTDLALSSLIEDLHERGLAERTLLLVMSEFGRTPTINANAGRDHWAKSYSILWSGGGIRPGNVYGQSDRVGAFPRSGRVFNTADICATVYDRLGIDPEAEVPDPLGRAMRITYGRPMSELF